MIFNTSDTISPALNKNALTSAKSFAVPSVKVAASAFSKTISFAANVKLLPASGPVTSPSSGFTMKLTALVAVFPS